MKLPFRIDRLSPDRRWLLLGLGLVVAPHLGRLPWWAAGLCLLSLGWRVLYEVGRLALPGRMLRLGLTLGTLGGVFATYHTIFGREAGVTLLLGLLCLKTLEMRTHREAALTIFLAFFVVITGFLFDQSLLIGVYMFGVVWVLLVALIAAQHRTGGGPAIGLERVYVGRAGLLLAQALPLLALLFVLFPRVDTPLWAMPEESTAATTGLSEEMSPGQVSRLADSPEVAFRVQFKGPIPGAEHRYWRGPVLGAFDGRTWSPLEQAGRGQSAIPAAGEETVDYTLTLEPHRRHWLFALDLPASAPAGSILSSEHQLFTREPLTEVSRYALRSRLGGRSGPYPEPRLSTYRQLPDGAAPRARALAARWREEAPSPEALVRRTLDHFADEAFYYTREPPLLRGDPVDDFLFESRHGYCEHYASAFVVLMRAAGLPARVVTGYLGGEVNPLGGYLIIRQSDAHAWAEVWLAGEGWVRIDPTAAVPSERIVDAADQTRRLPDSERRAVGDSALLQRTLRQLRYGWDRVNHTWNQWVIGYDSTRQQSLLARIGLDGLGWGGLAALLFGTLGGVLVLIGVLLIRGGVLAPDPVQRCYLRFCRKLAGTGLVRGRAEGPAAFARRVARDRPDLAGAVWNLTRLYINARYGPAPNADATRKMCRATREFQPARRRPGG